MIYVTAYEMMGEEAVDDAVHHPVELLFLFQYGKVEELRVIVILDINFGFEFILGERRGKCSSEWNRQVFRPEQSTAVKIPLLSEVFEERHPFYSKHPIVKTTMATRPPVGCTGGRVQFDVEVHQ